MVRTGKRMRDHPFTDEEVELIAGFSGLTADQVRGVAWLTVMKLGLDEEPAHIDGDVRS